MTIGFFDLDDKISDLDNATDTVSIELLARSTLQSLAAFPAASITSEYSPGSNHLKVTLDDGSAWVFPVSLRVVRSLFDFGFGKP